MVPTDDLHRSGDLLKGHMIDDGVKHAEAIEKRLGLFGRDASPFFHRPEGC